MTKQEVDSELSALAARLEAAGRRGKLPATTGADIAKLKRAATTDSFRRGNGSIKAQMKRSGEYHNSKNR